MTGNNRVDFVVKWKNNLFFDIGDIEKTMYPHGYHYNKYMATHVLEKIHVHFQITAMQ